MLKQRFLVVVALVLMLVSIVPVMAQDDVTLVYWSMWNETEPQAEVIQGWIDGFAAETGIQVDVTWNGRQNQTLARTALSAGQNIDLIDQDADPLAGGLVLEGLALSLNDYLDTDALDADGSVRDVFTPGVLEAFAVDGEAFLYPYVYNTVQFWYSKQAFADAGVEAPATWEEFLAVNQALLDAGYDPIAAESDVQFYQIDYLTYPVVRKNGAGFLLETIADPTGEMWRDPVYLETAQQIRGLWDSGYIPSDTEGYLWPAGQQTLGLGIAGMELVGSWLPIELSELTEEGFEWGAFNFPAFEGGEGSQNDLMVALLAFMITRDSAHPDEAFEFLRYAMTQENQQALADAALVGSTRQGVEWASELADGAEAAANAEIVFGLSDNAMAIYPEYTNNILFVNWSELFLGQVTAEEFVENMVADSAEYWANQD